ncbi:MAG: bifunctional phosphoribosyl-AMP cyclohydrolase/phosphoribosyl-ATP diphosphatase HisIE [Rhodanobacteraceae bacterium]|nr:bifunctional phosphoribosyl-AMP cyclohydrolase/phosphoribosyl-ATP diphosphatase HisIE [Rhodanobacteraceae bacterium]MBP9153665.1 bifunctional phosphoribosyl-AMP cyclohydrolase/phosphoribosyl-ATP diphosphatase HisIE [Xanthomonadales bacterium]HQW82473.1 bifunctional phosphoribosyl-AMP cyclohydrolase/phosphoribosyl-ATP diphosphatase HisIE [Pseudomonadota bacterium]
MNPTSFDPTLVDFAKGDGLVPVVVQDAATARVLMLGYMNREALAATLANGWVTFWSRSKQRLWTKGESSGHTLGLVSVALDCDADTLLVLAQPNGPTCHRGCDSCFDPGELPLMSELARLDSVIAQRLRDRPEGSYTTKLAESGIRRVAQKVGEEGVEAALAAVAQDEDALVSEAADLIYHLGVALRLRDRSFDDVLRLLRERHR